MSGMPALCRCAIPAIVDAVKERSGEIMRCSLTLLAALAATFATFDHAAAQPTCSGARDTCIQNVTARGTRGVGASGCHAAYAECMTTGVWDTRHYGAYAVRRTGMAKR
jgi:hypothetical protein